VTLRPISEVPRGASLIALALLLPLGLLTKRYHVPAQSWVHASAGDVLNATFWLFLLLLVNPRLALPTAGGIVFLYCSAVEFSQLVHTPSFDALRRTLAGRLLLGSEFDITDIGCYALGTAFGVGIAAALRRRSEDGRERGGK